MPNQIPRMESPRQYYKNQDLFDKSLCDPFLTSFFKTISKKRPNKNVLSTYINRIRFSSSNFCKQPRCDSHFRRHVSPIFVTFHPFCLHTSPVPILLDSLIFFFSWPFWVRLPSQSWLLSFLLLSPMLELLCPTSNESSAKNPTMNHAPVSRGRKSVSVGSVCVLGKPWLELLANRFLLLLLLLLSRILFWGHVSFVS